VVAPNLFLPPGYNSSKYVHHLPSGVQDAVKTISYSFAVQGGVMRGTATAMEISEDLQTSSLERLLLSYFHRVAEALCCMQRPWSVSCGTARDILRRVRQQVHVLQEGVLQRVPRAPSLGRPL
jgi:hypothetical protein